MEMAICEAYRVPHSHFLGGPPRWTQQDRDKAIWYQVRRAETCGSCGTHPDDFDEAKGGRPDAWRAVTELCKGCQKLAVAKDRQDAKDSRETPLKGARLVLKRREPDARDHGAGEQHSRVGQAEAPPARRR